MLSWRLFFKINCLEKGKNLRKVHKEYMETIDEKK